MFARFVEKYLKGERVTGQGSGIVKRFVLRHPMFVLRALCSALLGRGEKPRGQGKEDLEQEYAGFSMA